MRHEEPSFCSTLLKSKPAWRCPEEFNSVCVGGGGGGGGGGACSFRISYQENQVYEADACMEIFAHILRLERSLWSPLKSLTFVRGPVC